MIEQTKNVAEKLFVQAQSCFFSISYNRNKIAKDQLLLRSKVQCGLSFVAALYSELEL